MRKSYLEIGNENIDLIRELLVQGRSQSYIASTLGCERRTLVKILKFYGLYESRKVKCGSFESNRKCNRCGLVLPLDSYYKTKKRVFRTCKECYKIRSKEYYDNKVYEVSKYKASCGCLKCGDSRHYVLEFHHKDPSQKDFSISDKARTSLESLMSEIEKCVVLCSNCHHEFHYLERRDGISIDDYITKLS